MRAVMLGLALTATMAAGFPGAASAASQGWTQQPVPLSPGAVDAQLTTVSCASADDCLAGGGQFANGSEQLLGERWDGSSWQLAPFAPDPTGEDALSQVLCTTASTCFMVGSVFDPATENHVPLAERWNGSTWTVQAVPVSDGNGVLDGISCPSSRDCIAVGLTLTSGGYARPLAEHWNGAKWFQQPIPRPGPTGVLGGENSQLSSVSCSSADSCTAVGDIGNGKYEPLAEYWDGAHWTIQSIPALAGAKYSSLSSVSCPQAGLCLAAGSSYADRLSVVTAIAEIWTGGNWSQQTLPLRTKTRVSHLAGISCASASRCTAVGGFTIGFNNAATRGLIEYWNGSRWAIQAGAPPNYKRTLAAVSCSGGRTCAAVGTFNISNPVAETENQ